MPYAIEGVIYETKPEGWDSFPGWKTYAESMETLCEMLTEQLSDMRVAHIQQAAQLAAKVILNH